MLYWPDLTSTGLAMAVLGWILWIVRFLVSAFLSLVVFAAFMLWLVVSAVMTADLRLADEGRATQLVEQSDNIDYADVAQFRVEIEGLRDDLGQDLARARTFLMVVVVVGLVVMGLIHLPDIVESLAWTGYTLALTGIAGLVLGWAAKATLPERIGELLGPPMSDQAPAVAVELLQGMGMPGLWAALIGALLVVASHLVERWQRKRMGSAAVAWDTDATSR